MKDFFIERPNDILLFLKAKNFPFGPKEIVCLEFSPTMLEENIPHILKNVSSKTERLYFKGSTKKDHAYFCAQWTPQAPIEYSVPQASFYKTPWEKHLENSSDLLNLEADAIELKIQSTTLNLLIPTLMLLKEARLDFIFIDPSALTLSSDVKIFKEIFSYLKTHWRVDLPLLFSPSHPLSLKWEAQTLNPFKGPRLVDIDLCNACDHDCLFCGLHHPALKGKSGGKASLRASEEQILKLISELPPSVEMVTLGGAGEPFLHTGIMKIIRSLRERGINVCLFSNFAHMNQGVLDELQELVYDSPLNVWIIANISGVDPQSYQRTRPSQGAKTFFKIIKHLKYNYSLLKRYHKAATVSLMCVVNKENYKLLPEFVALSLDVGAFNLWFKTMEPHGKETEAVLLSHEERKEEILLRAKAQWAARKLRVEFLSEKSQRDLEIAEEKKAKFPLLKAYLEGTFAENPARDEFIRQRFTQAHFQKKCEKQNHKLEAPACAVAYEYLRLTVEGEVLPCCSFKESLGRLDKNLMEFWLSPEYQMKRQEMENSQYEFCLFCPHRHINERIKALHS